MRLLMAAACVQALTPPTTPTTPVVLEPPPPLEILYEGDAFAIVAKPGGVPSHASEYIGKDYVVPLLQRARDALGRRVNLVHRLDRGASGCVICAYADLDDAAEVTTALGEALGAGQKTYVALVRGEGFLREDLCEAAGADVSTGDLKKEGWFVVDRPIKDDRGRENNATTTFKFVASTGSEDAARASLVAARPATGRWHQIRRHLNGLSHPILGDSSHGNSRTNREWRKDRDLPGARLCLHLCRISLPATDRTPARWATAPTSRRWATTWRCASRASWKASATRKKGRASRSGPCSCSCTSRTGRGARRRRARFYAGGARSGDLSLIHI